jgi:hypothetical protein
MSSLIQHRTTSCIGVVIDEWEDECGTGWLQVLWPQDSTQAQMYVAELAWVPLMEVKSLLVRE